MDIKSSVITLTFGDQAENHVGMEKIGNMINKGDGYNKTDLQNIKYEMNKYNINCDLINLSICEITEETYVLVLRDGVNKLFNNIINRLYNVDDKSDYAYEMFKEQSSLDIDKKALMYGRVVNKTARWNLCFDDKGQEPNYEIGKGRIIPFEDIPITKLLYDNFNYYFGKKSENLKGEGNYYYNINKCGIGYHGDSERRKVIAIRLGTSMPLYFQWYKDGKKVNDRIKIELNGGDIYIMSEKAIGTDWKRKNIYTLRHATGCYKFVN